VKVSQTKVENTSEELGSTAYKHLDLARDITQALEGERGIITMGRMTPNT